MQCKEQTESTRPKRSWRVKRNLFKYSFIHPLSLFLYSFIEAPSLYTDFTPDQRDHAMPSSRPLPLLPLLLLVMSDTYCYINFRPRRVEKAAYKSKRGRERSIEEYYIMHFSGHPSNSPKTDCVSWAGRRREKNSVQSQSKAISQISDLSVSITHS